mmetsp:Transcript_5141/g.7547  ORF Transcript_5141/g.7547 Transcript_5141/m.7547 type:complete len:268 (+) Transcript_5141:46-849(+)
MMRSLLLQSSINVLLLSSISTAEVSPLGPNASRVSTFASRRRRINTRLPFTVTAFAASAPTGREAAARAKILDRRGAHFELSPFTGKIEFGNTAVVDTPLDGASAGSVSRWLSDTTAVANAMWEDKTRLSDGVWRLNVADIQFITIGLAPTVDLAVYADREGTFHVQSVAFDPNVKVLGVGMDARQLDIDIKVCGELTPSRDGSGLTGRIGFQTAGNLPPPMRLLPPPIMQQASAVINGQIMKLAKQSFQKGVRLEFRKFLKTDENK